MTFVPPPQQGHLYAQPRYAAPVYAQPAPVYAQLIDPNAPERKPISLKVAIILSWVSFGLTVLMLVALVAFFFLITMALEAPHGLMNELTLVMHQVVSEIALWQFVLAGMAVLSLLAQAALTWVAAMGTQWARIALTVVLGFNVMTALAFGGFGFLSLLPIVAAVLLFVPDSNRWFRIMEINNQHIRVS